MKANVESRIKAFDQELEKFSARWYQLKPGSDAMDGDHENCIQAVKSIKERKQEFEELQKTSEALVYVIFFSIIYQPESESEIHLFPK